MKIADIISATMLATLKHDDLLPMKDTWSIEISNDKISFYFEDGNTLNYTIDKDGNKVEFPPDRYRRCDNCRIVLYTFYNYCPTCGTKQTSSKQTS